jgi:ATP-dependent RNA helicase DeaD
MSHPQDPGADAPEGAIDAPIESLPSTPAATENDAAASPPPTAPADDDAAPPLPASFDEFELPQTLREAIAECGWAKPTPVQAATFAPIVAGHDVLVQSQTGTGKTGAFCVPWLAARFEPGDAADTGVQLIALTPTRELAKQVCDELTRLARHGELVPLPIYGGTAMQPQLAALRTGVHAVVGTPGRVLDHIRRRSLDLSRVRMVVLDEADEMLSMGFLEDIHAILEACPRERQTTLFSATVPTEIERIARRYMRSPVSLRLSGDDVAAAAIDHAYYSVSSSVKTRDLLDVIAVEEPATALVFCNTREEVNLVASVLQREGFAAEPLSSDLTQAARERVLGWMREGRLRFLVATDVASRGIDISHISHVINYSFPENAESYVHRTGRTGRAGRAGQAISLIAASELGNFYYLKLQYPTITFTEKQLPPGDALQQQRSELKLDHVSRLFPELVSPEWTLLARNLMKDPRGERVIAFLLEQAMAARTRRPSLLATSEEAGAVAEQEPGQGRWERSERGRGAGGGGGGRDRGRAPGRDDRGERHGGGRDRFEGRGRSRDDRPRTDDRPRDDAPPRDVAAPDGERAALPQGERSAESQGEPRRNRRDREGRRERERVEAERPTSDAAPAAFVGTDEPAIEADDDAPGADESGALPIAGDEQAAGPDGQRRRRRRRRGRRDREQTGDASAQTSAGGEAPALVAAGDDVIGDDAGVDDSDELAVATPEGAMGDDANPGAQPQAEGEQGRKRRRRRRRGRGAGEGPRPGGEATERAAAPTDAAASGDDDADEGDDDAEGDVAADGSDPNQRGRGRRRRRRGRRRTGAGAAEPAAPPQQVVVPQRPAGQDEIVVDIDESELQLVRDQFGEIDELDDFTLKARRRGVLDTLAEEVELEDLTARDRVEPPSAAANDAEGATDDEDDDEAEASEGDAETSTDAAAEDDQRGKRRRRRRKKKKVEAEPPPPALMVPPHKDFWEVWATHFNYRDFEDPVSQEPEPDPEPEPTRVRGDFGADAPGNGGDDEWVNVRLSVGRSHAKKAADIRDLLADRTGLTGKSVRNLTVGDRDTEFQIGRRSWARLARAFGPDVVIDGVTAEVTLLTVLEPVPDAGADAANTNSESIDAVSEAAAAPVDDGVPAAELPAAAAVEGADPASAP